MLVIRHYVPDYLSVTYSSAYLTIFDTLYRDNDINMYSNMITLPSITFHSLTFFPQ